MANLSLNSDKIINILLLGETGVGKSTFINAIVNYLSFQDFEKAEKENLIVLIPTSFMTYDKDGNNRRLEIGDKHKNEDTSVGASVTQLIRTYTFSIRNGFMLRLIDTPGLGDTRGPQQDEQNCEYILNYISNLQNLHAICILLRPQAARVTIQFRYCITAILSRLEKSACDNLIFIFTDSKDFTPGETYSILKKLAEDIRKAPPHSEIPLDKNKFCFDNEVFKYLAAKQRSVQFAMDIRPIMMGSWRKSTEQCWKLIDYISKLTPHNVRNTAAVNECRRIIYQLSQPMAEIAQNIDDNLYMLQRHEGHLKLDEGSMEKLKKKLYVPIVDLEVKELPQPVTVCTESKCAEIYKVGERTKWHYKARCHNPCYLTNVTKDIIGDPALIHCYAMTAPEQSCAECGCHYKKHMHVYYESTTVQREKVDEMVQKNINSKEAILAQARKVIDDIKKKRNELEAELDVIIQCNAKFAYFLQNNAITPINDCYEEYIKHLIAAENRLGSDADSSKVDSLKQLLREHNQIKATLKKAQEDQKKMGNNLSVVTPADIQSSVEELYKLQHNGSTILKMYNAQNQSRESEYLDSEYVHQGEFDRQRSDSGSAGVSGSNSGNNKVPQHHTRGRPQQRGNRGGRGGRGNNNDRQGSQRNEAPPTYDQSWRDFGRDGRPSFNNQSSRFQRNGYNSRASHRGRGGFNRQNSEDSDRRKTPSPNIQVSVTIPAEGSQSSARGGHQPSNNVRYESNYGQSGGYQINRNNPPRNTNNYRGPKGYQRQAGNFSQDYYSPRDPEYPPRNPKYPSRNPEYPSRNPEYPLRNPEYPPRDEYPLGEDYPTLDPRYDTYPSDNHYSKEYSSIQDNHSSKREYSHYPREGFAPSNDYTREYPPRNDNTRSTDHPPAKEYYPQNAENIALQGFQRREAQDHNNPSNTLLRDSYGCPPMNNQRGSGHPNQFEYNPIQNYSREQEPAPTYTNPPNTELNVNCANYNPVRERPASGSVVVEEYPRGKGSAKPDFINQPRGNEYSQRSQYLEKNEIYYPAEPPVGASRQYHRSLTEYDSVKGRQEYPSDYAPDNVREYPLPGDIRRLNDDFTRGYPGLGKSKELKDSSVNFPKRNDSNHHKSYPPKNTFYGNLDASEQYHSGFGTNKPGISDAYQNEIREELRIYPKLDTSDNPKDACYNYNEPPRTRPSQDLPSAEINEYPQQCPARPPRAADNFQTEYYKKNMNEPYLERTRKEYPSHQSNFYNGEGEQKSFNELDLEPARKEYPPHQIQSEYEGKSLTKPHLEPNGKEYQIHQTDIRPGDYTPPTREYPPNDRYQNRANNINQSENAEKNINKPPLVRREYQHEPNAHQRDSERPSGEHLHRNDGSRFCYPTRSESKNGQECSRDQRTAPIETHPENPFQTFEFSTISSRSTYVSPSEDLISFDFQNIGSTSKDCQEKGDITRGYPEEFGNIDNPVRVISPTGNCGYGGHQQRSGGAYQMKENRVLGYQGQEYPVEQHRDTVEYLRRDQNIHQGNGEIYNVYEAQPQFSRSGHDDQSLFREEAPPRKQ